MVQFILRGVFLVMASAVAALYAVRTFYVPGEQWKIVITVVVALAIALVLIVADLSTPRKSLSELSGAFLGLLVGMLAAYGLTFPVDYVATLFPTLLPDELIEGIKVFVGVICVFGAVSLILQTKDDFRFVIPYVEFSKQLRGQRPMVMDTSAIIDGRIVDVAKTQILSGYVVVPRFVLTELQTIADSGDKLKRARGRRGLDILAEMQNLTEIDVTIEEVDDEQTTVDQMLVNYCVEHQARLVTTDFNLAKVARVRSVDVINLNDMADALKPIVLPGERLDIQIIKPGESPGQGVGYREDGTMVVVDHGKDHIGQTVRIVVTSMLQTSAGRMVFGKLDDQADPNTENPDPQETS